MLGCIVRRCCSYWCFAVRRFFAFELFKQPVLEKYDWYMRLDTDSFLLEPYAKDPFAHTVSTLVP